MEQGLSCGHKRSIPFVFIISKLSHCIEMRFVLPGATAGYAYNASADLSIGPGSAFYYCGQMYLESRQRQIFPASIGLKVSGIRFSRHRLELLPIPAIIGLDVSEFRFGRHRSELFCSKCLLDSFRLPLVRTSLQVHVPFYFPQPADAAQRRLCRASPPQRGFARGIFASW